MSRKYTLIFILIIVSFSNIIAQKNSNKKAALASVAAVGILAYEIHVIIEMIELKAVNHIIENYPEIEAFKLKVLDLDGKKASDISSLSLITYKVTEFDKLNGKEKDRFILMMFTSKGWMNDQGVKMKLSSWEKMDKKNWNKIFTSFIKLNSNIPINTAKMSIPKCTRINESKYDPNDSLQFLLNNKFYKFNPKNQLLISDAVFKKNGLSYLTTNSAGTPVYNLVFPFIKLKNDEYRLVDYSDKYKLVCNERAMGLFLKNTNELIQLQRSLVRKIDTFLNNKIDE